VQRRRDRQGVVVRSFYDALPILLVGGAIVTALEFFVAHYLDPGSHDEDASGDIGIREALEKVCWRPW
jgi:hypothetical protein